MKTIFKYIIEVKDEQTLTIPVGSKILSVQVQGDNICLWAIVNPQIVDEEVLIEIFGTGNPIEDEKIIFGQQRRERIFIGTVQQHKFVWHIFYTKL